MYTSLPRSPCSFDRKSQTVRPPLMIPSTAVQMMSYSPSAFHIYLWLHPGVSIRQMHTCCTIRTACLSFASRFKPHWSNPGGRTCSPALMNAICQGCLPLLHVLQPQLTDDVYFSHRVRHMSQWPNPLLPAQWQLLQRPS